MHLVNQSGQECEAIRVSPEPYAMYLIRGRGIRPALVREDLLWESGYAPKRERRAGQRRRPAICRNAGRRTSDVVPIAADLELAAAFSRQARDTRLREVFGNRESPWPGTFTKDGSAA
jgi:hypothetical protein